MRALLVSLGLALPITAAAVTPLEPPTPPPSLAEQRALLAKPDAIGALHVYAVDERCFSPAVMKKHQARPSGLGVETAEIGKKQLTSLTSSGAAPAPFKDFADFVEKLVSGGHRAGYGLSTLGETVYGPQAFCLDAPPVLGPDDLAPANAAKADGNRTLVLSPAALAKLRKLPKRVYRVAVVHGYSLVLALLDLDELRARKEAASVALLPEPEGAPKDRVIVTESSIVVLDPVIFERDKTEVLPAHQPIIDNVAKSMDGNPTLAIEILGHTDGTEDPKSVGLARATAVQKALVKKGIAAARLGARGAGPLPSGDKAKPADPAKSRTVSFLLRTK